MQAMTPAYAFVGFEKVGVYPFNGGATNVLSSDTPSAVTEDDHMILKEKAASSDDNDAIPFT